MADTSDDHGSKAENALEDAIQHLQDALKHTRRRDGGSYKQAMAYVSCAQASVGHAEQALRRACSTADVEEKDA